MIPSDVGRLVKKCNHKLNQSFGPRLHLGVIASATRSEATLGSVAKRSLAQSCLSRWPVLVGWEGERMLRPAYNGPYIFGFAAIGFVLVTFQLHFALVGRLVGVMRKLVLVYQCCCIAA